MKSQPTPKPTLLQIASAFVTIGLTSIGGAAGPLRHVVVTRRRWVTEGQLAELYGLGQALPGSVVANVAVLLGPRYASAFGPYVALAGLIVPSMAIAIVLSGIGTKLAAVNPRFAAGEISVTAALAGIFVSNGLRVLALLWRSTPDVKLAWRCTRMAIGALGVVLVVGLHLTVPLAMIVLIALSAVVELRLRRDRMCGRRVMEQLHLLGVLAWHFVVLSLFTVGGGPSILLPQMRQDFVLQYHFLTDRGFTELVAVAQASPGPNFLIVPLIGYRAASLAGAVVSMIAFLLLPVTIASVVGRLLHRHDNEWVALFRRAFRPVTGGLWITSGIVIASATDHGPAPLGITIAVAALSLALDISPMWWCVIGGIAGAILA